MNPFLEVKNLTKTYSCSDGASSTRVFTDLNLQVNAGSTFALVGPSGSGKSTLLNMICGLDSPTNGEVLIGGRKVHEFSPKEATIFRNQTIGFIFQSHHLLPSLSSLENVLVPALAGHGKMSDTQSRSRAMLLLDQVGLASRANHLPSQLSGGERQRVAVARALINEPKLLLADEPTGALDRENADSLIDLLLYLHQQFQNTMLVVTHSISLANKMEMTWSFEDGKLNALSP